MSNLTLLILIVSLISLFVSIVPITYSLLLPIFKAKLSKKSTRYLYAFSSGFFMIMATVLFIAESKTEIETYFEEKNINSVVVQVITGVILASTVFLGLIICLGVKYIFAKKNSSEVDAHNHDQMIFNISDYNPKSKALAIFFMLSHRIPDGLIIGILASQISRSSGNINIAQIVFLVSFVIHIIPEELIIYYRQIEIGISKWKATRNSLIAIVLIIPIIIIGSLIGWYSSENIIIHIIQLLAAAFLIFTSIIEFFPEFIHDKIKGKSWYLTILLFIIGITVALVILSFHSHEHSHEHVHAALSLNLLTLI